MPPPHPVSLHVFIEYLHGVCNAMILRCFSDWIKATTNLRWYHILTGAVWRMFCPARNERFYRGILIWGLLGPEGVYSQKYRVGVCGPLRQTLTLFKTKINDFPYLKSKINTLFQTCLIISYQDQNGQYWHPIYDKTAEKPYPLRACLPV